MMGDPAGKVRSRSLVLRRAVAGFLPGVGGSAPAAWMPLRRATQMGDPFLGALIGPAVRAVGGLVGRVTGGAGLGGLISRARSVLATPVGAAVAGGVAAGGAGALAGRLLRGGRGEARRYRRMNVGNVKALRRSIRRVGGFRKLALSSIRLSKQVKLKKGKRS